MRCTSGSEDLFECNMLLGHKSLTASQSASTAAKSKVAARIRITKIVSSSPYWPESSKSAAGGGGMRTQTVIEVGISMRENRFGQRSRCRSEMTRVTLCRNTLDVRGSDMRQGERALTLTLLGLERVAADSHHSIKHSSFLISTFGRMRLLHGLLATCSPRICGPEPAPLRDGNHH